MKIATIVSLLAVISPCISALKGASRPSQRVLKGDEDDDEEGDDIFGDLPVDEIVDAVGCFSGSSMVQVLNKGSVAMKDLQIGDQVLTSQNYQPVYAFGHKSVEEYTSFIQFNGQLEMTSEHMVFLQGQTNPVRADSVQVGDVLRGESSPVAVTQIESVVKQGLYAPLTKEGTVVVDGIVASSYISLQDATNMVQVQGVEMPMSQQSFIHMALSPFRMVCSSLMECDSYDEQGIAPYVSFGMKFVQWGEAQNLLVQLVVLTMVLVVLGACMIFENSMGAPLVVAAAYGMMKVKSASKVKTV